MAARILVNRLSKVIQLTTLSLALCACSSDFASQMTLTGYRVIGVKADPPELNPDGTVGLQVHEFYDGDEPLDHKWRLCLHSVGAVDDYACFKESWEFDIGEGPTLALDLGANGLGLRARLAELPALPNEDGTPRSLAQGFDVWVKLKSGPQGSLDETVDTVKRLFVSDNPTRIPNANPNIGAFDVIGSPRVGETVTLRVRTDPPESYIEPSTAEAKQEEFLYTWYSTQGKADPPRSYGEGQASSLVLPDEPGSIEIAVAVRDGRGGLSVARKKLTVN